MMLSALDGAAKARSARQHAADRARLGGQGDIGREFFLIGDGGDALRSADAEVDDAVGRQFEGGAAGDDLALVEWHFGHAFDRHADFARQRRVVHDAVIHPVQFRRLRDDHAVDQDTGDFHVLGPDRPLLDDALDLRDDDAAIVAGGHGLGEIVEDERLLLHADIAGGVGRGAANKRHVDLGGDVEQPLLALNIVIFYNIFGGHLIDLGAAETRIDISVKPDLGEQARLSGGAGAVKLRNHPLRQIVAENFVFLGGLGDLGHPAEISRYDPAKQPFVMQASGPEPFAVAGSGGHDKGQVPGVAGLHEALFQSHMERFRDATLDETARGYDIIVSDERDRLLQRGDLVIRHFLQLPLFGSTL